MKTFTKDELDKIIKNHEDFIAGKKSGQRADLSYADLNSANFCHANLSSANFYSANFCHANLHSANFRHANLHSANFCYANLSYADLYSANLSYANFQSANFCYANLHSANFCHANLQSVNLQSANLLYTRGNKREINSILIRTDYPIIYTSKYLQIGCHSHDIEWWWEFSDERILKMDGKKGLLWWRKWKPIIKSIIDAAPAVETNHEEE